MPVGQAWISDPGRAGATEQLDTIADRWEVTSEEAADQEAVTGHRLKLTAR